jgi:hypothetical protein
MKAYLRKIIPPHYRPKNYLNRLVHLRTGRSVSSGPFTGLRYVERAIGSAYFPKLLGIYERELYPVVEEVIGADFECIINIGAGEGYYAVGFALRTENALLRAFEMSEDGRILLARLANLNGVTNRLVIAGKCEVEDLRECLLPETKTFVLCDTEGYEVELLDLERVPELAHTYILVELHEFVYRGVTDLIKVRFGRTHKIRHIWEQERTPNDFPYRTLYTRLLPKHYLQKMVTEGRPEKMSWLWMRPKNA